MSAPFFHSRTEKALRSYLLRPSHGLLLSGPSGIGKFFIAQWLVNQSGSEQYVVEKLEDKSTISIEQIRELYGVTRTGLPLTVIIKGGDLLGVEAQNAFLKLLEEPPENTRFILTSTSVDALLPTIRSRLQHIEVHNPPRSKLIEAATALSKLTHDEIAALVLTSEGKPGSFFRLLNSPDHLQAHLTRVSEAKKFYGAGSYDRHLICAEHKYDKEWAKDLLTILSIIVHSLVKQANSDQTKLKKLLSQADLLELTSLRLFKINGNPKIHLARLCQEL